MISRSHRILPLVMVLLGWLWLWQNVGCSTTVCHENSDCESYQVCLRGECSGAKSTQESAPSESVSDDAGARSKCPSRCSKDLDCIFCGTRRTCEVRSKTCLDARQICPEICNSDVDCQRTGCMEKQACNLVSGKCFQRFPVCPASCKSDADCQSGGCGKRTQCSSRFRACVDPAIANCPFACRTDAECAKDCGVRNRCSITSPFGQAGVCRTLGSGQCPASCRTTANCFVQKCGDKVFCNYATNKCVAKGEACPMLCLRDIDCSKHCGTRTYCYQSLPGASRYCRTPTTRKTCPASCRTSYDCKAKACGDKVFCNYHTRKCVSANDACPGVCKRNADCVASKCGTLTTCRRTRCVSR